MKDVIILSPTLKKEFARIKKHALKQISSEDDKDIDEDTRAFAFMIASYKIFHGLEKRD